ncbi:MAG: bifunctional 2-polyprenyl-6-hydroxyphenol methylase/3-demethylubiquinol 3-O-methyltransferase UbiG [Hyphomonadaceae bacterium]
MTLVDSGSRSPTIDRREVAKFAAIAEQWWRPDGKFAALHRMNVTRLEFIREEVLRHFSLAPVDARRPFQGLKVIDLGCGGGLVTEPMARLGAQVIGLDASEEAIKAARAHARGAASAIDYRVGLPESLVAAGEPQADIVLALEIVEHVADLAAFAVAAATLVKPGGLLFLSTINRTPEAFAFALVGAERILRWLPPGAHDYAKLVTPDELRGAFDGLLGLSVRGPVGMTFNPFTGQWKLGRDARINYLMTAAKAD